MFPMSKQLVRILLVIMTGISFSFGLGSCFFWLFSPMLFDAPGSEDRLGVWIVLGTFLSIPVFCFFGIRWSWAYYGKNNLRLACLASFLPFISWFGGFGIAWLVW
jgi:hypothetical protein